MLTFDVPNPLNGSQLEGELQEAGWPAAQVSIADDALRVVGVGDHDRDGVRAVIGDHTPSDPPADPDAELAHAIEGAETLSGLKDALLGRLSKGRAAGRPTD